MYTALTFSQATGGNPRDEHVTQNLCQSVVMEHLAKYIKYNTNCFLGLAY